MAKIRITEKQADLLGLNKIKETPNKKNLLKITKEQYNRIFASGLINESDIDKNFKIEFGKHDIKNLEPVDESDYQPDTNFEIRKPNPSIPKINQSNFGKPMMEGEDDLKRETIELVKYFYRKSDEFSPYWGEHNLTYDDICDTLKNKGILISKNGKCELSKSLGTPEQALKTLESELRELVGEETPELETEASNIPSGAEFDKRAPFNQTEPNYSKPSRPKAEPLEVVLYNREIAILKDDAGFYYAFFYGDVNKDDLAQYAEREENILGKDETGDLDIEYGDFEIDNDIIQAYVNDNLNSISKGEGLEAWEKGVDLAKIDSALKQDLISMYDKDKQITNILASIQETEDDFDKAFSVTKDAFVKPKDYQKPSNKSIIDKLRALKQKELDRRNKGVEETTTAASSGAFTAPIGMVDKKMPVDSEELDVPVVYETTTQTAGNYQYDANALPSINRDGSFKKSKKTKAEKNTQWAGGAFVDFNDCTDLNNKPAGSGCSQGATDKVVKLKKTSGNINAPSLSSGKQ